VGGAIPWGTVWRLRDDSKLIEAAAHRDTPLCATEPAIL
jgi:hypothetical protein